MLRSEAGSNEFVSQPPPLLCPGTWSYINEKHPWSFFLPRAVTTLWHLLYLKNTFLSLFFFSETNRHQIYDRNVTTWIFHWLSAQHLLTYLTCDIPLLLQTVCQCASASRASQCPAPLPLLPLRASPADKHHRSKLGGTLEAKQMWQTHMHFWDSIFFLMMVLNLIFMTSWCVYWKDTVCRWMQSQHWGSRIQPPTFYAIEYSTISVCTHTHTHTHTLKSPFRGHYIDLHPFHTLTLTIVTSCLT